MLRRSRTTLLALLSTLIGLLPSAAVAAERYRLITAETPERLERRLQAGGAAGFRLVGAARGVSAGGTDRIAVLVEQSSDDTTFDHVVVACSGKLESTDGPGVEQYAAAGYRLSARGVVVRRMEDFWLPETSYDEQMVLILERPRGQSTTPYRYVSLAFGSFPAFYTALDEKHREGFSLLGLWNSGRRLQVLLEKPLAEETASDAPDEAAYRLLIRSTRSELRSKLRSSARQGFRVVAAADPSITGPPLLLLRKVEQPSVDLTYRFFDDVPKKLHKDKLDRKLSRKARKGWRASRFGSTQTVVTLERERDYQPDPAPDSGPEDPQVFLALTSTRADFAGRLEQAVDAGYGYLGIYVEAGQTTVLLEKRPPTTNPAVSQEITELQ